MVLCIYFFFLSLFIHTHNTHTQPFQATTTLTTSLFVSLQILIKLGQFYPVYSVLQSKKVTKFDVTGTETRNEATRSESQPTVTHKS